jgi:hypothetical protein
VFRGQIAISTFKFVILQLGTESSYVPDLARFLKLSGVGRVVEKGRDEEAGRAEKMDGWIVWDHRDKDPD